MTGEARAWAWAIICGLLAGLAWYVVLNETQPRVAVAVGIIVGLVKAPVP